MKFIEARYIEAIWHDENSLIKLECSQDALELEKSGSEWLVESVTFPKHRPYLGFRIKKNNTTHTPYLILANEQKQDLVPLIAPGSLETWWIQSSGWDIQNNRHLSELYRTAGRVKLVIEKESVIVENNTMNFSISDLEYYLNDFKNNLWLLILNSKSIATGRVSRNIPDFFDEKVLGLFHDFADAVEKVTDKPSLILAETQGELPIRKVKPAPRTFRELAIHPQKRILNSRMYVESYDTVENRFIHFCVKRVSYILKNLLKLESAQNRLYLQKIHQEKEYLETAISQTTKKVDAEVLQNEIFSHQRQLSNISQELSQAAHQSGERKEIQDQTEIGTYVIGLGQTYGQNSGEYFVNTLNRENFKQKFETYLVLKFPRGMDVHVIDRLIGNSEIIVTGSCRKAVNYNKSGKKYYTLQFIKIYSIELTNSKWEKQVLRLQERRKFFEINDWISPLTREEKNDQNIEISVSKEKVRFYQEVLDKMSAASRVLPSLQRRLSKVEAFFKKNKVKIAGNCPNSMVFIQNPYYSASKVVYRKITNINGFDETVMNSLSKVDEIGLLNIANIYERWCLLQLIKILNQTFGYSIESEWKNLITEAILKKPENVEIQLRCHKRAHKISITYEKVLSSGKRPDFVIDLYRGEKQAIGASDPSEWLFVKRIILDAKFRDNLSENNFRTIISNLYSEKDYSEGETNQVFIIHPTPDVIKHRTSPLVWGSDCDYGQSDQSDHMYGGIFLAPVLSNVRTHENLQRLLGMFLQQQNHIIIDQQTKQIVQHDVCCISCGNSDHDKLKVIYEPTKKGNVRWVITCAECHSLTVKTLCASCGKNLFKNGPKWTYHRTRAEQTSNVVCPSCETFL